MPAVVYGIVAAVALGCSDFAASRAGRTESFFSVVRTNMAATALLCPFLLMVRPSSWTASAVVFGALSGVAMSSGLVVLYRGYGTGKVGIVAPVSSVVLSVVPVCFGFARGEQVGGVAIVGMAIGCAAVGLSSWQGAAGGGRGTMTSVVLGAAAGVLFGVAFSMMAAPGDDVGLVPLVVQRPVGFLFLAAIRPFERSPLLVQAPRARRLLAVVAVCAGTALASLQIGVQLGNVGPVSVASSQFATVMVLLTVLTGGERLRWWQGLGVAGSGLGVALMALA
jgi:drug/metabolite transporter (DMT)-like permease